MNQDSPCPADAPVEGNDSSAGQHEPESEQPEVYAAIIPIEKLDKLIELLTMVVEQNAQLIGMVAEHEDDDGEEYDLSGRRMSG